MLVLTARIVYKIRIVSDEHCIREELLKSMRTTGIGYIVAHIVYIGIYFGRGNPQAALLLEIFCISISDLFVIYYTSNWTRKRFIFQQKVRLMHQLKAEDGQKSSFSSFLTKRIQFQDVCHILCLSLHNALPSIII